MSSSRPSSSDPVDPDAPIADAAPGGGALREEALEALQALTGRPDAQFHQGQFEAIEALVEQRRRVLVVQRTGWGKSAVYFIAALLQRRRGRGPALIISPLLALMRDQVAAAERAGVRAVAISSANPTEWSDIEASLARDEVDVLLISPERLVSPRFAAEQLPHLVDRCGLLVVDEAHCISDWGHDFRPDYRRLRSLIAALDPSIPVLATTATANARVVRDVAEQLGVHEAPGVAAPTASTGADGATDGGSAAPDGAGSVLTLRGPLTRDSLRLGCLRLPDDRQRLAYLASTLDSLPGSGIIYTLTVSAAEDVAALLHRPDRPVRAYTGRTDAEERAELEEALRRNEVKALAATSALGMGFDKPDLGFVVHLGAPSSPVAYYQQVGRAGRATDTADVLLLPGEADRAIWEYFATASMPDEQAAQSVLHVLAESASPLSTPALEARVDLRRTALELLLKVLAVDGAVRAVQGGWVATGQPWEYDAARYAQVARLRREEQDAMLAYERLGGTAPDPAQCRMVFLARELDDETAQPCGRCDVCAGPWYPRPSADGTAVGVPAQSGGEPGASAHSGAGSADDQVRALLERVGVPIAPRAQWPQGLDRLRVVDETGRAPKGKIPEADRAEEGRVLARLSDLGWAPRLRPLLAVDENGAAVDGPVPEDVGRRIVEVLADWRWAQRPAAVIGIGSRRRPELIRSLVDGIAATGRLQNLELIPLAEPVDDRPASRSSAFRVAQLWDRFTITPELREATAALGGAPILLVDDEIDTRWTMTIVARLLRRAGAGPILPLALAQKG